MSSIVVSCLLTFWIAEAAEAVNSKILVDGNSPHCNLSQLSQLVCDFSTVSEPVYLMKPTRYKRASSPSEYKSLEIRSASVFYLAETGCLEDISIRDTKEVIVADSYQKTQEVEECQQYQLSLINSSITNIPVTVTRLDVIRSSIKRLVMQPSMKRASVLQSQIKLFDTNPPLTGTTVVDISYTNIVVGKLQVKGNAKVQFFASNLTLKNVDVLEFHDNATVIISKSRLISSQPIVLKVESDVSVTLEATIGKVTIKRSPDTNIPQSTDNSSPKSTQQPQEDNVIRQHLNETPNQCNYMCCSLLITFVIICVGIVAVVIWKFHKDGRGMINRLHGVEEGNDVSVQVRHKMSNAVEESSTRDSGISEENGQWKDNSGGSNDGSVSTSIAPKKEYSSIRNLDSQSSFSNEIVDKTEDDEHTDLIKPDENGCTPLYNRNNHTPGLKKRTPCKQGNTQVSRKLSL